MADAARTLKGKTIFISGGSRGIGLAIAKRAAADGANIIIAAKTADPHPKLPGTIYTAAKEIEEAGGKALPLQVDIRYEDQVEAAMAKAAETFGGIDVLINNASAVSITGTLETSMKKFDLMHGINLRGTYLCSQKALPYLKKASNPHILNLSPPPDLSPKWFAPCLAYTMAKYGMSFCAMGIAAEFKKDGIAANALWPRTAIATAAIEFELGGKSILKHCRTPAILADVAHIILTRLSREATGNFYIDDEVLAQEGITDLSGYAVQAGQPLLLDFFLSSGPGGTTDGFIQFPMGG
ncbi:MAG: NAD(P)-dependent oxidoreductase [Rhodospirillaceae bacterium]|nr:NAD(P)-dependent oxidoreductase [Rhodospirillaceae bacterium]